MSVKADRKVMKVLDGETLFPPPIWMMRQAGRYLPEYRATRTKAGGFLDLCYNPELATEVTLQPITRFGFDAAILFSDILVIPDALGQDLRFAEGEGPILTPLKLDRLDALKPDAVPEHLAPVFKAIGLIRAALPRDTTLLGFCGAPWTVATYMIAGHGTSDQGPARRAALAEPTLFQRLIDMLVDVSVDYLSRQLDAGADAVQLFDTWAGVLDDVEFERWVIRPTAQIVAGVRARHPQARIIGFPKGSYGHVRRYVSKTGINAVGLDWTAPLEDVRDGVQPLVAVQGTLDPMRLITGGKALDDGIDRILDHLGSGRLIFNLGHGITPDANPDHVRQMVDRVQSSTRQGA